MLQAAATLLLLAGIHPKVVSEMLGHSSVTITLTIDSHVLPMIQRDAADAMHRLLGDEKRERGRTRRGVVVVRIVVNMGSECLPLTQNPLEFRVPQRGTVQRDVNREGVAFRYQAQAPFVKRTATGTHLRQLALPLYL
jgi:hypothetical protein